MEYKLKQAEAADMCRRIISVIVGKYIDQIVEAKNDKIEISVMRPHSKDAGMKIVIEVSKDGDTSIKGIPLNSIKYGESDVWTFIEKNLPDYYHRDDILQFDICSRYVDNEDVCDSDLIWIYKNFGSDKGEVQETIDKMEKEFAYEALTSWLEEHGPECW
jgi:hypothetical protein